MDKRALLMIECMRRSFDPRHDPDNPDPDLSVLCYLKMKSIPALRGHLWKSEANGSQGENLHKTPSISHEMPEIIFTRFT